MRWATPQEQADNRGPVARLRRENAALVAEIERLTGEPTEGEVEVGAREIWRWFVGSNLDGFYRHAYAYDREKCMDACRAALRAARGLS